VLLVVLAGVPAWAQQRSPAEQQAIDTIQRLGGKVECSAGRPGAVVVVHLGATGIADAGLAPLTVLGEVRTLILSYNPITDAGLTHVARFRQVQHLHLGHTRITDAGLPALRGLTNLRKLWLTNTAVTEQGVAAFRQAMPQVEVYR
jgi:hypothetical protein